MKCITKKTGTPIKLNDDSYNNIIKLNKDCIKQNGHLVSEKYIIPNNNKLICSDKDYNKSYHTILDCSYNNIRYRQLNYPINEPTHWKVYGTPHNRKNSRFRWIFLCLFLILILHFIWFAIIPILNYNTETEFYKKWILTTSFIIILIIVWIVTFCPLYFCSLEPDSYQFRKEPITTLYLYFCNIINKLGFTPKGCL